MPADSAVTIIQHYILPKANEQHGSVIKVTILHLTRCVFTAHYIYYKFQH